MLPFLMSVLSALVYIAILVFVVLVILWVIETLVGPVPPNIIKLGRIIVALVCVIILLGVFLGGVPAIPWAGSAYHTR